MMRAFFLLQLDSLPFEMHSPQSEKKNWNKIPAKQNISVPCICRCMCSHTHNYASDKGVRDINGSATKWQHLMGI